MKSELTSVFIQKLKGFVFSVVNIIYGRFLNVIAIRFNCWFGIFWYKQFNLMETFPGR